MRVVAVAVIVILGAQSFAHATCGERGGPGYRAPDGHCVGWAEIGKHAEAHQRPAVRQSK